MTPDRPSPRNDGGMSQRLPSVLSTVDLPLPELIAARLDGEVFALDGCFCPVDEIEQPWHRARAVHMGLSERLIAEQFSAAWVWGAADRPPQVHQLCVTSDARVMHSPAPWISVREVVIEPPEIAVIAGLQVTTPLRTAVDIARFSPLFDDRDEDAVVRLMTLGGFDAADCIAEMERRRNLPQKRQAVDRFGRCRPPGRSSSRS